MDLLFFQQFVRRHPIVPRIVDEASARGLTTLSPFLFLSISRLNLFLRDSHFISDNSLLEIVVLLFISTVT